MKTAKRAAAGLFCLGSILLAGGLAAAQDATVTVNTDCNSARFNLEPRLNAGPQHSESVDFLLNRVSPGVDLVVGAGNDTAADGNQNRLAGFDAYYVHRAGANCVANFEGTISIASINPTVAADAPRDAFFFADDILGSAAVELARTSAATLIGTTTCPNGSQINGNNPKCWPVQGVANFISNNPADSDEIRNSAIAVDPRTTGTGAGDLYVAAQIENTAPFPATSNVQVIACSNLTLTCGSTSGASSVVASGTDTFGSFPDIHVRADGVITVSYWTFTKPFGTRPNPIDLKFVTCTPQGAPAAPICSKPTLVATSNLLPGFSPGDSQFSDTLYPKHADRLNADGKTFTTFLVWDRCKAQVPGNLSAVCTKIDVVLASSTNNGVTWSAPEAMETTGHQFFGAIRLDASTKTTNIVYYSTQDDQFSQRAKIRLRQIAPGSTTLGAASILTPAIDPDAGIQDINESSAFGTFDFGAQIGLAAAGTGTAGQSKVYVHYTSTNVNGVFSGILAPDQNNTLVGVSY